MTYDQSPLLVRRLADATLLFAGFGLGSIVAKITLLIG